MSGPPARVLLVLAVVGTGCGVTGDRRARAPARKSLLEQASFEAPYPSPARFRYHPRTRATLRAELALPGDHKLWVGDRGERWLVRPGEEARPGGALAPEALLAVARDQGLYWFVGESGTSYAASQPLGPFEMQNAPPEALRGVSATGAVVLGVRLDGSVARSADHGLSWASVEGVAGTFVDTALSATGDGLLLAVPEALYETHDFGQSYGPRDAAASHGTFALGSDLEGTLQAHTPLGWLSYRPGAQPTLGRGSRASEPESLGEPERGPDAGALAEGRATVLGDHYVEIAPLAGRGGGFELWSGPLAGPLRAHPVEVASQCRAVRLAAFGAHRTLACFSSPSQSGPQPIKLFSSGPGRGFQPVPGKLFGTLGHFLLSVGRAGRWLVSGVCDPGALGSNCPERGVQHAIESGSRAVAPGKRPAAAGALSSMPALDGPALALGFSTNGRIAYAVGRRQKTKGLAVFVSRDGGLSFEARDLSLGRIASDETDGARLTSVQIDSLNAAEDGTLSLTVTQSGGRRSLVVLDEDGKLLSTAGIPENRALLGAAGLRALAIVTGSRQVWESLDGGVTWLPVARLPFDPCPGDSACEIPVRCAPQGCVIGHELTRIGWGGQTEEGSAMLPPPSGSELTSLPEPRFRAPIACALSPGAWQVLPGVSDLIGAHEAVIGRADWFALADDPETGTLTVFHATQGRVEPTILLGPVLHPEHHAYAVMEQIEGVAAIRYRTPESLPGRGNLTDIEVVWDNLVEGRIGRARLPDGGGFSPGDYVRGSGPTQSARPDLLSVAQGGVYVRVHHEKVRDQPTFFLDGKRVTSIPAVRFPVTPELPSREEMVHVGGAHVPILLLGRGAAVVRARRSSTGFDYTAFATGMANPILFGLLQSQSISYVAGAAALAVERFGLDDRAGAMAFPFRADGAVVDGPVPLPTQRSLPEQPQACDGQRRSSTPRFVASPQIGIQHPVVVTDTVEAPRTLITRFAVLHGTPDAPCVAAFDAVQPAGQTDREDRESALILMHAPERSILLRLVDDDPVRVEYREMECHVDPTLEIPPEVYPPDTPRSR